MKKLLPFVFFLLLLQSTYAQKGKVAEAIYQNSKMSYEFDEFIHNAFRDIEKTDTLKTLEKRIKLQLGALASVAFVLENHEILTLTEAEEKELTNRVTAIAAFCKKQYNCVEITVYGNPMETGGTLTYPDEDHNCLQITYNTGDVIDRENLDYMAMLLHYFENTNKTSNQ